MGGPTSPVGVSSLGRDDGREVKGRREHVGLGTRVADEAVHQTEEKEGGGGEREIL